MGRLELIQGPQLPVVTLAEAKAHLKVDTSADDANITALIAAATQYLDGPRGIIGRALRPQTWQLLFPVVPIGYSPICLPLPPTISVDSVSYLGSDGVPVVMDETAYRVIPGGANSGSTLVPATGTQWPAVSNLYGWPDEFRITFTAGYLSVTSPEDDTIPEPIKLAIKMLLSSWYDKPSMSDVPEVVGSLIASYRTAFLG